ncbi:MAG: hypothetical protein ABWJ97_00060, partial [Thermoproteus sp.]
MAHEVYRLINTIQELHRGSIGTKLVATSCEDWTIHVEPRVTGSGWIVDNDMRRIVGARCL